MKSVRSILIIFQRDATQSSLFIILYMFRVSTTPIIRSKQNCNYSLRYWSATSFQCGQASSATLEVVAAQKIWPVPEAVFTVLCTPDDGYGWHPKHVEWIWNVLHREYYLRKHHNLCHHRPTLMNPPSPTKF